MANKKRNKKNKKQKNSKSSTGKPILEKLYNIQEKNPYGYKPLDAKIEKCPKPFSFQMVK